MVDRDAFVEAQTCRSVLNSMFGHGTPICGPVRPDPRSEFVLDAIADISVLVKITKPHEHESFCELWVNGRCRAFCANTATALALAAMALRISANDMNEIIAAITEGN